MNVEGIDYLVGGLNRGHERRSRGFGRFFLSEPYFVFLLNRNLQLSDSMITPQSYNMSFQTGSLLLSESVKLAELYLKLNDWAEVRGQAGSLNLFQTRTISASRRIASEVIARLKGLHESELLFLTTASASDQAYVLWIAICRRYKFIGDFAGEVIRERYLAMLPVLSGEEFDSFFGKKAEWHPELENMKASSRKKWKQTLFKMLREANLLSEGNCIQPALFSPHLIDLIAKGDGNDVLYFPIFNADFRKVLP